VAGELERRWNEALQAVNQIEGEIAAIIAAKPPPLGERERQQLMSLAPTSSWPGRIQAPRPLREVRSRSMQPPRLSASPR
jgi:hypothetical protein